MNRYVPGSRQSSGHCHVRNNTTETSKKVKPSHTAPPRSRGQPPARETRSPALPASGLSLHLARRRRGSAAPPLRRHFREATPGVCGGCFRRLLGCWLSLRRDRAREGGRARAGGPRAHRHWSPAISSHGPGPSAAVTELPRAVTALPAAERAAGQSALPEPPRIGGRACPGPDVPAAVTGQVMGPRRRCQTGQGTQPGAPPPRPRAGVQRGREHVRTAALGPRAGWRVLAPGEGIAGCGLILFSDDCRAESRIL